MIKSELGSKRVDPETGQKFYDLNRDPVISPYTGKSYPLSFFEHSSEKNVDKKNLNPEVLLKDKDDDVLIGVDEAEDDDHEDVVSLPDLDDHPFPEEEKDDDDEDVNSILGLGDDDE